ncbi:MAG: carboxypeptidase regulatory-like domain-containing protein [Desulfuromonadales bacterium]|nr:carboxypeptidase regulatory-like domain-containing protein [Desulfuromonadales bacterium]
MIRMRLLLLCLLVFGLLPGCTEPSNDSVSVELGHISGTILTPLEGTTLNVYKKGMDLYGPPFTSSNLTGEDGSFDLALPPGEYIAVARKRKNGELSGPVLAGDNRSDFITLTVNGDQQGLSIIAPFKVGDSRRLTAEVAQTQTGLSGLILDSDGRPVEGARVHVYDHVQMSERPKFVSEKTAPNGSYLIYLPKGGTYYLAARDKFGGPPKLGDLYGRYDQGTIEPSAVVIEDGKILQNIDITVTKVW